MLRKLFLLAIAAVFVGVIVFWLVTIPATVSASALGPHTPNLDNGKTMFNAGGCASCHAVPKQDDRTRLGGGLALHSPFGTFHVPNISSDQKDGIGAWTEVQFVTAMVKGTSPSGEHYYPAFPYTSYQRIALNDLRDLFAYLKTLPAVAGKVRDHELPFPFSIRRLLGGWKFLFLDGKPFTPDGSQSAQWNRGAYLVNGPGHCAECHSPRNALGGIEAGKRFSGGPNPEGKGFIPNITQARLKSWSVSDIASVLSDGLTPEGDSVGGSMTPVIKNTSQLSKEDREAMATYIKSLAPVEGVRRKQSGN
ncbi:MAG: c-type cytochrome [Xanthobacteraceae bacterium]|jgi:mono/diheme cytochrome c family protein|uniref:c-type cytochrome n=1 Tax=Pseudolabrys sp. TaxID=1960880 RepID=UPI003D129EF6